MWTLRNEDTDPYRELNLNSPTFSSSANSQNAGGLQLRFVTLSLSVMCSEKNKTERGGMVGCLVFTFYLWCSCGTSTHWKGHWGIVEGGGERTAHLISLLSEFVYMWKTALFPHRRNCNSEFHYF